METRLQHHRQDDARSTLDDAASPTDEQKQKEIQPSLTPPQTSHNNDRSAVESAIHLLSEHRKYRLEISEAIFKGEHPIENPVTSIPLTLTQYESFLSQLKEFHPELEAATDRYRYDYDSITELLMFRMAPASITHGDMIESIKHEISKQIDAIQDGDDASAKFAKDIHNVGNAEVRLVDKIWDKDGRTVVVFQSRSPDGQFRHLGAKRSSVILEAAYSQPMESLKKRAEDYIKLSRGKVKVVIGIDISRMTKKATVSVWRLELIHETGMEPLIVKAEETTHPFRAADGSFVNSTKNLCLRLGDFTTDEVPSDVDLTEVKISYEKLATFLNRAEKLQAEEDEAIEDDVADAKLRAPRAPTPPEKLTHEDEKRYEEVEKDVEDRIEAENSDFVPEED